MKWARNVIAIMVVKIQMLLPMVAVQNKLKGNRRRQEQRFGHYVNPDRKKRRI